MDSPVRQETIDVLIGEAAREVERHRALLAKLEAGTDRCAIAKARELLRVLETEFAVFCHALEDHNRAAS